MIEPTTEEALAVPAEAAVPTTLVCDVCEEELEWVAGSRMQHLGGEVGYFHVLVGVPVEPEDGGTE